MIVDIKEAEVGAPQGYGLVVYDPNADSVTVLYKGEHIGMPRSELAELNQIVSQGQRYARIAFTKWEPSGGLVVPDRGIDPARPQMVAAPAPERVAMAESLMQELELLREFYQFWEVFHALAKQASVARHRKEKAAQNLTDCAGSLRTFYEPLVKKSQDKPKLEAVKLEVVKP